MTRPGDGDPAYEKTELRGTYDPEAYAAHDPTIAGRGYASGATGPVQDGYPQAGGPSIVAPGGQGTDSYGSYTSGGYQPAYPAPQRGGGRSVLIAVMVASIVIIAACLAVGAYLLFGGSSPATPSAAPSVATVTAGASGPGQAATPSATRGPGSAPSEASPCDQMATGGGYLHAAVNSVTTCGFAENVRRAYAALGHPGSVTATSPTTGLTYTMTCDYVDATTALVRCAGGDNAEVWVY